MNIPSAGQCAGKITTQKGKEGRMKKLSEIKSIDDLEIPDNLNELLRKAAKRKMSRAEKREQKISWVIGMMPYGVNLSREEAERIVDDA